MSRFIFFRDSGWIYVVSDFYVAVGKSFGIVPRNANLYLRKKPRHGTRIRKCFSRSRAIIIYFSVQTGTISLVCSFVASTRAHFASISQLLLKTFTDPHPQEWYVFYHVSPFVFLFRCYKNVASRKR